MRWEALLLMLLPGLAAAQVTATFRNGSGGYLGMRDVAIVGDDGEPWQPSVNYEGGDDWIDGSPNNEGTLMRFELTAIPAGATVSAVTLTLTLLNGTGSSYGLYPLNRSWVPGQATWNSFATGGAWQTAGAQGAADRGSTSFATITGTGTTAFAFNASGRAAVQQWITNVATNHGFTIQDYLASDGSNLASCDHATAASRPQLVVVTNLGTFTFKNGVAPGPNYSGCTDVAIASGANPELTNWDDSTNFELDTTKSIWVSVDVSSLPRWSSVLSASMDTSVISAVTGTFDLFEARRPWVENAATWRTYDGANAWQVFGGQGVLDRDSVVVGQWVNPATGNETMFFHDAGVALVERWIRQPSTNLGFVIWNPLIPDPCRYSESEVGTVTSRPRFNVTYVEGKIAFGTDAGTTGLPLTLFVRREQLDGTPIAAGAPEVNVAVSTAVPAQLSTDGGGWASAALLQIPAGASATPLFVRSASPGSFVVRADAGDAWFETPATVVFTDAGPPDAGTPDAGPPDAGTPDAGTPDAGTPDAGTPDAGTPDAGSVPDAGSMDAGFASDAGPDPTPRLVGVGCDCNSVGGEGWLGLLLLALRRRSGNSEA